MAGGAAEHEVGVLGEECSLLSAYPPAAPFTAGQLSSELRKRLCVCGSFSKSHAMTGWRLGFALARHEWIRSMLKVQSHSTSNANSMTQRAGIEAALGPQESVREMIDEYQRRRDLLVPALKQHPWIGCDWPGGACFWCPDAEGLLW